MLKLYRAYGSVTERILAENEPPVYVPESFSATPAPSRPALPGTETVKVAVPPAAIVPHVCGSCGREFSGKKLRELTVHHKDHDHNNNPTDGSNWELLCIYCHDHEHEKYKLKGYVDGSTSDVGPAKPPIANPFDNLDNLLKVKPKDPDTEPK